MTFEVVKPSHTVPSQSTPGIGKEAARFLKNREHEEGDDGEVKNMVVSNPMSSIEKKADNSATKHLPTTHSNQSYKCPKCFYHRSDNHRHDSVYICRDCGYRW